MINPQNHMIGYDSAFLDLRKKYYAESQSLAATLSENAGPTLTEFCVLSQDECGKKARLLTHPSSYFSPSLRGTDSWGPDHWRSVVSTMGKAKNWDLARFMLLTSEQARMVRTYAWLSGKLTLSNRSGFWVVPGNLSFEQYLETRSAKHNRNNRRCFRNAEKAGFTTTQEMTFDEISDVYSRRSDKIGGEDYSVTDKFMGFLKELRESYRLQNRWMEIGVRDPKGTLCGFAIGFWDAQGVFYIFQTAYDPAHRSLRIGSLVFDVIIEKALTRGSKFLSFTSNSEYISLYARDQMEYEWVDVFSYSRKGLYLFAYRLLGKINNWIRTSRSKGTKSDESPGEETSVALSKVAASG